MEGAATKVLIFFSQRGPNTLEESKDLVGWRDEQNFWMFVQTVVLMAEEELWIHASGLVLSFYRVPLMYR